jgi:hypothetical protein
VLAFDRKVDQHPEALRLRQHRCDRIAGAVGECDHPAGTKFDHDDGHPRIVQITPR